MRLNISQLGAFSRGRAAASLKARERSNTGSARNTPKFDMDLLARMQHLASVNCASHRMLARSSTSCVPGPGTRARMSVGISFSHSRLLYGRGVKEMASNGGRLRLMIRNVRSTHRKKDRPELIRTAIGIAA